MTDCDLCMGRGKLCVGLSYPRGAKYYCKAEYDPCPACTPPPHTFHAKRTAQILCETRAKRTAP